MEARPYQLLLLDYLTNRNGIVYLPTGSGKTFIAILAIKRFSQFLGKSPSEGGKRAIFMCNTVELARQQFQEIKRSTNLLCGLYIGERNIDAWPHSKWNEEIEHNQVLIGTAQIFVNIVSRNFLRINDLSIVVIDECHHATKSHPMNEFMRLFQHADQSALPRVVGLSAVLLKGNKLKNIVNALTSLEAKYRGNIITVTRNDFQHALFYSTAPKENLVVYETKEQDVDVRRKISCIVDDICNTVSMWDLGNNQPKLSKGLEKIQEIPQKHYIKTLTKDFLYQMDEFGLYPASHAIITLITEFELKKRRAQNLVLRNLYRYTITQCELIRHILVQYIQYLDSAEKILRFSTPKLRSALLYIKNTFESKKKEDICCMIFVERRSTAKYVYLTLLNFIDNIDGLKSILNPDFMVGRNTVIGSAENILERKWSLSTLHKFRAGECNVIVCSAVLEEGIDVQGCNYVFILDKLKTFNAYVQTKGRARMSNANYTIFTSENKRHEVVTQIGIYKEAHNAVRSFLMTRSIDHEDPNEDTIAKEFQQNFSVYKTSTGACLHPSGAVSLLHRYCQTLPNDVFGCAQPWFDIHSRVHGEITVSLRLPVQSHFDDVILSDSMASVRLAKQDAAFKACVKLHQRGQLNDNLLPITKVDCLENITDDLLGHWKKYENEATNTSKRNQRVYRQLYADELTGALPVIGEICYAYKIHIVSAFEESSYNIHIKRNLMVPACYAILLNRRLPRLAEMSLFMNQGRLRVKINDDPLEFRISNEKDLEKLIKFQYMLYHDILERCEQYVVLNRSNSANSYLIVPINNDQIDWGIVNSFQRLPKFKKPTIEQRETQIYRAEDYLNKVVRKWYCGSKDKFLVVKVHTDMSPASKFSDDQFDSYEDFITSKYQSEVSRIYKKDQFMLEVKPLTSRRNFFVNSVGKNGFKVHRHQSQILLIPETVHNYKYPSDMWLKAIFLPCILHRVNYLLHAETIRKRINRFLNIDVNSDDYKPMPIVADQSLKRAVDDDGNAYIPCEAEKRQQFTVQDQPIESHETKSQIMLWTSSKWKDYMEPLNIFKTTRLYQIELDYYYKFTSEINTCHSEDDDNISLAESQLKMSQGNIGINFLGDGPLAITDVPLDEKKRIAILDITAGKIEKKTAEQYEFLAALTTSSATDIFDMERFEILGDSFLKLAISCYLINKFPLWHEGFLTTVKSQLVSNRNLLYCMLETDIPKRIYGSLFQPHENWLPPMCGLPEPIMNYLNKNLPETELLNPEILYQIAFDEDEQIDGICCAKKLETFAALFPKCQERLIATSETDSALNIFVHRYCLRNKVVADTLEALLGVCVKNYGIHDSFRMLKYFGVIHAENSECLSNLLDLNFESSLLRVEITPDHVTNVIINYKQFEENLGYTFKNRGYLVQALTHSSFPTSSSTGCYQELEFLGDAILDFLISSYIFEHFQTMTPGTVTDLRSALVNNVTLACVCVRHRFHLFLLAENKPLMDAINNFVEFQKSQNYRVTSGVHILMEEDDVVKSDAQDIFNISSNVDVPKVLGDILEAIIAAVYLDSRDLETTWNVIYNLMVNEINEFSCNVPIDPVRQLHEHKYANPVFITTVMDKDVMVKCIFTCLQKRIEVNGFGVNAKQAKKAAAKHALQILVRKDCI